MVFDRLALVGIFDEVGATIHWSQRSFLLKKLVLQTKPQEARAWKVVLS